MIDDSTDDSTDDSDDGAVMGSVDDGGNGPFGVSWLAWGVVGMLAVALAIARFR